MKKTDEARKRILDAALNEFAGCGFGGARMERIARKARINKAMLFYYFSSKENLYRTLINGAINELIPRVYKLVLSAENPQTLIGTLPSLYVRFSYGHQNIVKMIALELIQNPENITSLMKELFSRYPEPPQEALRKKIVKWHKENLIREKDPVQLILNLIPLTLLSFIAKPMVEAVLDEKISDDRRFIERRIQSVVNLLRKGVIR